MIVSLDFWIMMGLVVGMIDAETIVMYWDKIVITHAIDWVPTLIYATFYYIWEFIQFFVYIPDRIRDEVTESIDGIMTVYQPFRVVIEVALIYYILKWKNQLRVEWRYAKQ